MVIVTSVFLTQLLCLLVPCDPQYQLPDTRPADKKVKDVEGWNKEFVSKTEEHFNEILHENKYHGALSINHQSYVDARQLKTVPVSSMVSDRDCEDDHPFVKTQSGVVGGYRIQVVGGRRICAFEGIPFAEAPVGHLRFRPPVPKLPWKGILKATQYGPPCMQYNVPQAFRTLGKEDCLFLNVYTVPKADELLPVIVFIHGGGFFFGSSSTYGPTYFLQKDILLVTIQYRLGVLGFISTADHVVSGNMGLKDQGLALKWVNENIEAFGGDKNRVTIMGQSAGAAAVHLHMLSHSTRQYFQRAVSLSGTAFNYWSHFDLAETRNFTNAFAERLGCPTDDSKNLIECLREKHPVELVALTPEFLDDWPYPSNAFRPSIEVTENNPDPFLTDSPENIYRRNEVANIPWISTTVSGEGYAFLLLPFIAQQFPTLQRNWYDLAIDLVDAENLDVDHNRILKRLTRFYFKNVPPEKSSIHTYAQIVTDRTFLSGIYEAVRAHVQVAPTYSYLFDFNGQYNVIVNYGYPTSEWGVAHTEDVFYMFNSTRIYSGFQRGELEYDISNILVNVLSNFAAKGEPLYTTENGDVKIWQPHQDPNNLNFLGISKYIGMIGDPFIKRMKFWRNMRLPDTPSNVIVSG